MRGASWGPGLVYVLGSVNPNDLVANSVVGATYGYSMLWVLIVAYGLHYFIAEATSRYVLATGESIIEGYGRLGKPVVLGLAAAIFIRRHLNNLYLVLLLGTSAHFLIPLPIARSPMVWSLVSFALAFWLMIRGGYRGLERLSRVLIAALAGCLVVIAAIAHPSPLEIARGLFLPSYPAGAGVYSFILLLMAVASTTVGSINHLKYPAYVFEKGWRSAREFPKQRADLRLSVGAQFGLAVLIQVAAAATLHGKGGDIRTVEDLSRVFSGSLGETGRLVFGAGLWVAVLTSYIGSNTGYSFLVADVYERFLRGPSNESRDVIRHRAYRVLLTFFCFSALYVVFTSWKPLWLGIVTSAAFVLLMPLLMAGLLRITNDRARMKDRANGLLSQIALWSVMAISLYLSYQGVKELIR